MKKLYFKDIGNADLEPISYYIKKFDPSFYMGMHNHAYFEIMYASKGNFVLEILSKKAKSQDEAETTTVTVHQGELVFLDAHIFHRLRIEEEEVVIYNVELQPSAVERDNAFHVTSIFAVNYAQLIERTGLKALAYSPLGYAIVPDLSKIDFAFRELITGLTKTGDSIEDACCARSYILLFLTEIAKSLTFLDNNNSHYVKKTFLYIKHHLQQKISLDDIAKELGYHKSYLAAQFKKYTGKTIVQTVNEMRVSKSLRLLRDTSFSVAEISSRVGFPSYEQMVHVFRKSVGMSPSACRKLFLNDEMDYNSPQYSSIAIRMNEEDRLLSDESFYNAFYRKKLKPRSRELLNY